ncbi:hypothetical protein Tco_0450180 [Tanacetum coccineum]
MLVSMLSLSDLIFSGGGDTDGGSDDEGSAVANSVMHASADGDRGFEGTRSFVGTAEGSAGARIVSRILLGVLFILLRIGDSNVVCDRAVGKASAGRGWSFIVPLALHQKLTKISMAQN